MKFAVSVVSPPGYIHSQGFQDVAECLHHGLLQLGHDAVLTTALDLPGRQHIVLGGNLLPFYQARVSSQAILYNLEQVEPGSSWFRPEALDLMRRYQIWDYNQQNIAALSRLGVTGVRWLPVGYVPELTRIAERPEDIDVLFFGSLNDRRVQVLDALERRGLHVQALVGVYGARRDDFIARARIVLNHHYYEAKRFEVVRVSYLLANRRFVVSERGTDPVEEGQFAAGVVFAEYDDLVEVCCRYLRDEAGRRQRAEAGLSLMRARPQAEYLRQVLSEARLAA